MSWKVRFLGLFKQALDEIPESAASEKRPEGPLGFSEEDVKAREAAAVKKAKDDARIEFAEEMRKKDADRLKAEHKSSIKSKIDGLVEAGKVAPAWVKGGLLEFAESLPYMDDAAIEFSEGSKKTPSEWFLSFLSDIPKLVDFSEVASKDKDMGSGGAAQKLEQLTRKKMEEAKHLTYSLAFAEVQKEHPDLVRSYETDLGRE